MITDHSFAQNRDLSQHLVQGPYRRVITEIRPHVPLAALRTLFQYAQCRTKQHAFRERAVGDVTVFSPTNDACGEVSVADAYVYRWSSLLVPIRLGLDVTLILA